MASGHVKGLLRGAKIGRSHTTVIGDAKDMIVAWKSLPSVTKISLGMIEPTKVRTGPRRVKFAIIGRAVRAQVRGVSAIQTLWVYGNDLEIVLKELQNWEAR